MRIIHVRNVHQALPQALDLLVTEGVRSESRNGDVIKMSTPVATVYSRPQERVISHGWRDANPFFHFFEAMWMLAGRRDVASLSGILKRMASFSDDGEIFHAAYGHRWIHHFGVNQLDLICQELRDNPTSRRAVLTMWDPKADLGRQGKDLPCNDMAVFQVDDRVPMVPPKLNMTVFCRSNDIIWGCYGANAVHFSYLLDYMASRLDLQVGTYTQISVDWHGYLDALPESVRKYANGESFTPPTKDFHSPSVYELFGWAPPTMFHSFSHTIWKEDLHKFVDLWAARGTSTETPVWKTGFFRDIAQPIMDTYLRYTRDSVKTETTFAAAVAAAQLCESVDWRVAMSEWIQRRWQKWERAASGGPESAM